MATRSGQKADGKTAVSLPVILVSVALLLVLICGLAWHFFGPNTGSAPARALTAEEQANQQFMKQKASESGGDFNRLSQEDQRRLFSIAGPRAPFELRQMARSQPMVRNPLQSNTSVANTFDV
jgi:hypothetical protein